MKTITKAALGIAGVTAAAGYGVCTLIDELLFNRKMVLPESFNAKVSGCDMSHLGELLATNMAWLENYGYEKHYITSNRGQKLVGFLMKPEKPSDVFVFGAHGYRSSGKKEFCGFAQYYLQKGVNVFFPDHIASGESEGNFCSFGHFETLDCLKWLDYLKDTFGKDIKIILHGVSMGAATVMMMSGKKELPENVLMTVADCGFTTAVAEYEVKLQAMGVPSKNLIRGVNAVNKLHHGFDFFKITPVESVKQAKLPMLFVHGTADGLVPCFMSEENYAACASEHKEILLIEGADHAQCHVNGKEEYEATLDRWLDCFVFFAK